VRKAASKWLIFMISHLTFGVPLNPTKTDSTMGIRLAGLGDRQRQTLGSGPRNGLPSDESCPNMLTVKDFFDIDPAWKGPLPGGEIARYLAAVRGWRVFCCHPGTKVAATGKGGLDHGTTDLAELASMFLGWPEANVGINCGTSGLIVVDLDWPKDGGITLIGQYEGSGMQAWDRACAEHGTPLTYTVITRSGGRQLYFKAVSGRPVGCSTGGTMLGPAVDIKSIGGYVMAAGSYFAGTSRHPGSGHWRWDGVTTEIAELPDWLLPGMPHPGAAPRSSRAAKQPGEPAAARIPRPAPTGPRKNVNPNYVRAVINGDLARVAAITDDVVVPILFRTACNFGHIGAVRGINLNMNDLANALLKAAVFAGLDADDAIRHIGRGIEFGLDTPKHWKWNS
jgi:hypothetical protein